MADLKPLGSEKLNGDDKLKRILELTYYKNDNNKGTTKAEIVKESKSGGVYGIVKERDGYYVKRGLNESSLDYIGGMFMKNKNKFSSYAEALKRLELIKGQDELLNEATKYVLKQNKPQEETPAPVPAMPEEPAMPAAPVDDMAPMDAAVEPSSDEPSMGGEDMGGEDMSDEDVPSENKRSDYMAEAQKYAGKLGQELRDLHNKMESDDIKYILNMVISAVDLDRLDDEDIEDIADKFDRDEEKGTEKGGEDDFGSEEPSGEETPEEEPISADKELGEESNPMDALENFINSSIDEEEYSELDENDFAGLGDEEEMNEFNIEDYSDLDEEEEMGEYKPDYVSSDLDELKLMLKKPKNYDELPSAPKYNDSWGEEDEEPIYPAKDYESEHEGDLDESNDFIGKFQNDVSWVHPDNKHYGQGDETGEYDDEETFDDYETFNSKYQGKHKWFGDKGHSTFRMYKDKYGPFSVRNRKPKEMDSEVEIDLEEIKKEINNNIHTTLSKYFK